MKEGVLTGLGKAHRTALDPTDRQASRMMQHAGWDRVAANWARGRFRLAWFGHTDEINAGSWYAHVDINPDGGEWLSDQDLRKEFNAVKGDLFGWSEDLSQNVSKNAIIHMGKGLAAWGDYCKARKHGRPHRKVGFPPVRKRYRGLSFTVSNGRNSIRAEGRHVRLPRIGWVPMREELRFDGDIMGVTVSQTAGRWFVSFQVDTGTPAPAPKPGPDIGIDMGVKTLATLWDGEARTRIENPEALTAGPGRPARHPEGHRPLRQGERQALHEPATAPLRQAGPTTRQGCPHTFGPPPQGHHANSQTRRLRDGGDPEHRRDEAQPTTGAVDQRRRHGRIRTAAGIQVRVVRHGIRAGGSMVPVLQDMQCLRGREAVAPAFGTPLQMQPAVASSATGTRTPPATFKPTRVTRSRPVP